MRSSRVTLTYQELGLPTAPDRILVDEVGWVHVTQKMLDAAKDLGGGVRFEFVDGSSAQDPVPEYTAIGWVPSKKPTGAFMASNFNPDPVISSQLSQTPDRRVFIVYGHNEAVKHRVARVIEKLKLEPVLLDEEPDAGNTVIEKLRQHGNAAFAIVILSADDEGRKKGSQEFKLRARQNVIFEFGYFVGGLGRDKVCALYEDGVDLPSDLSGILYKPLTSGWELDIAKEMKSAGLPVDLNDLA